MLPLCTICSEPLFERAGAAASVCILCAHRTTSDARRMGAGVIDAA